MVNNERMAQIKDDLAKLTNEQRTAIKALVLDLHAGKEMPSMEEFQRKYLAHQQV